MKENGVNICNKLEIPVTCTDKCLYKCNAFIFKCLF